MCFGDRSSRSRFAPKLAVAASGSTTTCADPLERVKSQNPGARPSWLWGRQASCLPTNRRLEASHRDETLWASWATKFRQLSDKGIYYADKRTLLPLTEDN